MPIDAITTALVSGLVQVMATEAWATWRPRIVGKLGADQAERNALGAALDEHRATVRRGSRIQVRNDLTAFLHDYAATHPDAADTFQALVDELTKPTTVTNDRSIRTGDIQGSIVNNGGPVATNGGTILGANSTNIGDGNRFKNTNNTNNTNISNPGSSGKVLLAALAALAGLAAVVLVVVLIANRAKSDDAQDDTGPTPTTSAQPKNDVSDMTCGEWLRLPAGEAEPTARDIALRLGNKQAAADVWIVQNTQYNCGGVEDRQLADVLAPTGT